MRAAAVALKASSVPRETNERESLRPKGHPYRRTLAASDVSRLQLIETIRSNVMAWTRWKPAISKSSQRVSNQ